MHDPRLLNSRMLELESQVRERTFQAGRLSNFIEVARGMMRDPHFPIAAALMEEQAPRRTGDFAPFVKAAQAGQSFDSAWATSAGRDMSQAFLNSIAEGSILEQLFRFGFRIPNQIQAVLSASGAVADVVTEGFPAIVKNISVSSFDPVRLKAAAILVMSLELARATGTAARDLFERELRVAVLQASNAAALAQFTSVTNVAGTGTALGDLNAGLAAAERSTAYVVAADPGAVRELALQADGRMGINGGEFIPGVAVVPIPSDSSGAMRIIPASRVGILDDGFVLSTSEQGSVSMSDTPTSPAQQTSLWQVGAIALLATRSFALVHDVSMVEVG